MKIPNPKVFLAAAILQDNRRCGSCFSLTDAYQIINKSPPLFRNTPEHEFYAEMFKPHRKCRGDAWWPFVLGEMGRYDWDNESRIYALLLAAEMLKNP